jgi:hypothetical protein
MGLFMPTERPLTLMLLPPDTMDSDASLKRAFLHFWSPYMTVYLGCTTLYPLLFLIGRFRLRSTMIISVAFLTAL